VREVVGDQERVVAGLRHARERGVPARARRPRRREHDGARLDAHLDLLAEAARLDDRTG
jgi:hypothetical protein